MIVASDKTFYFFNSKNELMKFRILSFAGKFYLHDVNMKLLSPMGFDSRTAALRAGVAMHGVKPLAIVILEP